MTFDFWVSFWQFLLPKIVLFSMMYTKKTSKDRSFGKLNNLNKIEKKSDRMQIKTLHVNKQP